MPGPYHFAPFELRPAERRLLAGGRPVVLGARAFDVLLALVEQAPDRVGKDKLLERAWPGLVVEEANVHVQVSQLRRVLGARAITTVPGLGYRFTLPLQGGPGEPAVPGNLPAERSGFVGRAALLEEAAQRLAQTRLLTLTGIGGAGKTRLALSLARRERVRFPDGVWFVDLAPLDDAAQAGEALAAALGVQPAGAAATTALAAWLRARRVLVVLDNCEHLLDATATLADGLLAAAPGLTLLATSREALGLPGEALLAVRPLALPDAAAGFETIAQAEAVALFVQRAGEAEPAFALDAANAAVVAEICRRVDGIPLAIELAAAQLRLVTPAQLHALLEERFRLMLGGRRALPRQQSLRTVIDWSLERLGRPEHDLLGALAAATPGCDFDAACALAADAGAEAVLASLARLADLSLVAVRHEAGTPRYVMLEAVRQLVLERLAPADAARARSRLARHFVGHAEAIESRMHRGLSGAEVIQAFDRERENLLRAFDTCLHDGDSDAALRLGAALRHYWPSRGRLAQGLRIGRAALDSAPPGAASPAFGLLLTATTQIALWLGRADEARALAERLRSHAQAQGDGAAQAGARLLMGEIARAAGQPEAARAHFEAALALADAAGETKRQGDALHGLAHLAQAAGRHAEARVHFEAVLARRRALGHPYHLGVALLNCASAAVDLGDAAGACERLREAAMLLPQLDSTYLDQSLVDIAAAWLALEGRWEIVAALGAAGEAQRRGLELPFDDERPAEQSRRQEAARAALGDAAHAAACARGRTLDLAAALACVRASLAGGTARRRRS